MAAANPCIGIFSVLGVVLSCGAGEPIPPEPPPAAAQQPAPPQPMPAPPEAQTAPESASPPPKDPPPDSPAPIARRPLILRLMTLSVMARGSEALKQLPDVSVYEGGLVILRKPGDTGPTPAELPLIELRISERSIKDIHHKARALGMTQKSETILPSPGMADGNSTRFELNVGHKTHVARVSNMRGHKEETPGLRESYSAFAGYLRNIPTWAEKVEPAREFTPEHAAALIESLGESAAGPAAQLPAWSLPTGRPFKEYPQVMCSVLAGKDLASAQQLVKIPNPMSRFRAPGGAKLLYVSLRPLLPDEAGCEDLPKAVYGPEAEGSLSSPAPLNRF